MHVLGGSLQFQQQPKSSRTSRAFCHSTTPPLRHSREAAWRSSSMVSAAKGFGNPASSAPKPKKAAPDAAPPPAPCPCGSGKAYKNCCQPHHTGVRQPATPEAALRARFSAFVEGQQQFIADTTHPSYFAFHYEGKSSEEAKAQYATDVAVGASKFEYEELSVSKSEPGSSEDEAFVAFIYKSAPKQSDEQAPKEWKTTNEKARFLKVDGRWLFADYQRFEYNMNSLLQQPATPEPMKS